MGIVHGTTKIEIEAKKLKSTESTEIDLESMESNEEETKTSVASYTHIINSYYFISSFDIILE